MDELDFEAELWDCYEDFREPEDSRPYYGIPPESHWNKIPPLKECIEAEQRRRKVKDLPEGIKKILS